MNQLLAVVNVSEELVVWNDYTLAPFTCVVVDRAPKLSKGLKVFVVSNQLEIKKESAPKVPVSRVRKKEPKTIDKKEVKDTSFDFDSIDFSTGVDWSSATGNIIVNQEETSVDDAANAVKKMLKDK